jgi:endonuclease III
MDNNETRVTITDLREEYNAIVENNNWKDTNESLILKQAYNTHPNRPDCLECGRKSTIECQYH